MLVVKREREKRKGERVGDNVMAGGEEEMVEIVMTLGPICLLLMRLPISLFVLHFHFHQLHFSLIFFHQYQYLGFGICVFFKYDTKG